MIKIIFNCETKEEMVKQREIIHKGLVGNKADINSEITVCDGDELRYALCDMDETSFYMIVGNLNDNNTRVHVKIVEEK